MEVFREFVVAKRRDVDEATTQAAQTWSIGLRVGQALAGKLPDLKVVLAQVTGQTTRQTVDEQRTVLHMISHRYGIPLRKAKSRRKKAA